MKNLLKSIAFQLWALFSIIGLSVSIPLSYYYSHSHYQLLEQHNRNELESMARASSLSIEVAIKSNDFEIVEETIDQISKDRKFAFIAILEKDDEHDKLVPFKCFPDSLTPKQPYYDTANYHLMSSPIESEIINGAIILGASRSYDKVELAKLNRPIRDLTILANVILLVLFSFFLIFITNPIRKASRYAASLSSSDYSTSLKVKKGRNEISVLYNSLIQLKNNLIVLRNKNESLMNNLKHEIDKQTAELKLKSQLQELLIKISTDYLNIDAADTNISEKVRGSLGIINNFIASRYAVILKIESKQRMALYSNWSSEPDVFSKNISINLKVSELKELINLFDGNDKIDPNKKTNPIAWKLISNFISKPNNPVVFKIVNPDLSIGGFIIFEAKNKGKKTFANKDIQELINVFIEMIVNIDSRHTQDMKLKALQESLETKVIENTQRILTLTNNLVAQDKLAMIGEISAGVAHDLNTPLGAIKSGIQGIKFCQDQFVPKIEAAPKQYVLDAFKFADNKALDPIVGGIQIIKEKEVFAAYFESNSFPEHKSNIEQIISLLVEIQIPMTDKDAIHKIMSYQHPVEFLNLVKIILMTNSFCHAIEESIKRSVEVVSTLKTYVKQENFISKSKVNLKENINNVIAVFRYRLTNNITLEYDVDESIYISGNEIKLFQLWSNIIKNAIDSMENKNNAWIRISSSTTDDRINITIANNGPEIPQNIQDKIFKKFFSTKQVQSGSGLGLSIVKSVVEEHGGSIQLVSDKRETQFIISFPKTK